MRIIIGELGEPSFIYVYISRPVIMIIALIAYCKY